MDAQEAQARVAEVGRDGLADEIIAGRPVPDALVRLADMATDDGAEVEVRERAGVQNRTPERGVSGDTPESPDRTRENPLADIRETRRLLERLDDLRHTLLSRRDSEIAAAVREGRGSQRRIGMAAGVSRALVRMIAERQSAEA